MEILETGLPDLLVVIPARHGDHRGWFTESWNKKKMSDAGINAEFVQDNHSYSAAQGTLRGMHYQSPPNAQAKLIQCLRGELFDVVVDVRKGSPTFGEHFSIVLNPEEGKQLYVPEGFIHGFLTLKPDTEITYKCSDFYAPKSDGTVLWNSVGVDWSNSTSPILSEKDMKAVPFQDWDSPFAYKAKS